MKGSMCRGYCFTWGRQGRPPSEAMFELGIERRNTMRHKLSVETVLQAKKQRANTEILRRERARCFRGTTRGSRWLEMTKQEAITWDKTKERAGHYGQARPWKPPREFWVGREPTGGFGEKSCRRSDLNSHFENHRENRLSGYRGKSRRKKTKNKKP